MPGMIHIHTDGSLLDGACNIDKLCKRAVELGYNFLGITDHGNMINALKFQKTCEKYNIKPLIGCEFYFGEPESEDRFHLILIAKNNKGLENLYELNRYAYEKNFYYKPRIDTESLCAHREGLICTTACLGSEFAKHKNSPDFENIINKFYNIFQDDFYLELQNNNIPEQHDYNCKLLDLSNLGFKYIMTCDTHYVNKEDYDAHDTMLCMQIKKKKEDTNRFRFSENSFYLKSPAEMFSSNTLLKARCEYGIQNLADKCDAHIELDQKLMPHLYDSQEENRILAEHCNSGFKKRIEQGSFIGYDMQEVVKRVYYELNILKTKGYSGYFLIVEDYINHAKSKGIYVGPGRGSACGSEIAFILGITEIEPIKYGLLFERFLNPDRNSPPDKIYAIQCRV